MSDEDDFEELIELHGRDFQQYSVTHSLYLVPVDEDEEERLVLQSSLFFDIFGQKLFLPPIEYPRRVLDCGYGRGTWAVHMAQMYASSQITAIDIYAPDFPEQPENLDLEVWNLNDRLAPTFPTKHYDLIHSRCVSPGIAKNRWRSYVRELANMLRTRGWLQLAEYYYNIQSHSGRLTDEHAIYKWGALYRRALEVDRNPRVYRDFNTLLQNAGLHDIRTQLFQIPIGTWPTDPREQAIGEQFLEVMDEMIESHSLYLFTQNLDIPIEEVNSLIEQARAEMRDNTLRLYMPLYAAWGRRR